MVDETEFDIMDADYEARLDDSANCCQFFADGYIQCSAIGSEDCDWCPHRDEIGQKVERGWFPGTDLRI